MNDKVVHIDKYRPDKPDEEVYRTKDGIVKLLKDLTAKVLSGQVSCITIVYLESNFICSCTHEAMTDDEMVRLLKGLSAAQLEILGAY